MEKMVRHITRSLYVPLVPSERDDEVNNMLELIKANHDAQDKISALQEAIKLQKANVKVFEESIQDSARKLKYGVLSDVPCKMILDWPDKNITVIRKDIWDTVESREMTEYDKPELTDEMYDTVESNKE